MKSSNKHLYIFLLLLFCQNYLSAQGTWERLNSPTENYLRSVYFVDSLYGWAVGDSGIIIHTSNKGTDWVFQKSNTENTIVDVFFLNRNLGWASSWEISGVPFGTKVLKTTDAGKNWDESLPLQEGFFSQCVLFLDSLNGWMGGKPDPIVRTTDGGISWVEAEIDSSNFSDLPVYNIQFYNSSFGYASGGVIDCCGIMWWTTNGGDYWYVIDTPYVAQEPLYQLHIFDSLKVLAVGGDYESTGYGVGMIRTSDGGLIWEFDYIGKSGVGWDIDFRTDYEAWSPLGGEEKFIYSLDSGFTWNSIPTPENTIIYDIVFPDSLHGYAVGKEGAILKYNPPVVNSLNYHDDIDREEVVLYQNYPNPYNPLTKIKYSIPEDGFIKLAVYNLLGEEVSLLVSEKQNAGNYEIEFNSENFTSGIYIYSIEITNFRKSRKMILIR